MDNRGLTVRQKVEKAFLEVVKPPLPHLYGRERQPSPQVTITQVTFHKIQLTVYKRMMHSSQGKDNPGRQDSISSYKHFGSPNRDKSCNV